MMDYAALIFFVIPSIGLFGAALWFCHFIWQEGSAVVAFLACLVLIPLAGLVVALAITESRERPVYSLDSRSWACVSSHREQQKTYVLVGKVMTPITSVATVCDRYERKR